MNKRYWFIVVSVNTKTYTGRSNFGYVTDDENPLNNKKLREIALKQRNEDGLTLDNFFVESFNEFKTEADYTSFWKAYS